MRRTSLSALIVLLVLAVGGCGEDKKEKPTPACGDDAETSSERAVAGLLELPPADDDTPFDDKGNEAIRGKVDADTPEEQAIADAWFAYWDARASSFFKAKVDPRLGSSGGRQGRCRRGAATWPTSRARSCTRWATPSSRSSDIVVKGSTATLTSCGVNKSIDRRADGSPAEHARPVLQLRRRAEAGRRRVARGRGPRSRATTAAAPDPVRRCPEFACSRP